MSDVTVALVEAERFWCQQWAPAGQGPDVESTWKHVNHRQLTGNIRAAVPAHAQRLRFDKVRVASEGQHEGPIGLGAGVPLPSGRHRVTYWVAVTPRDLPSDLVLVTLAIEANPKNQKLVVRNITAGEARTRQPMEVTLELDLRQPTNVDLITWWQGKGEAAFLRTECVLRR